jgi:hypothetical protein
LLRNRTFISVITGIEQDRQNLPLQNIGKYGEEADMADTNDRRRKKDSARLVWDTKPRRAPNPRDIEFQTAEVVIPNPHRDEAQIPLHFGMFGEEEIDKQKMNRLIWGDNLLAMQALLAQGYEPLPTSSILPTT